MGSNDRSLYKAILPAALVMGVATTGALVPTEASAQAIEEITVTARKREENLQEIPVAVSAFTTEDFAKRQITNINDVARFTPGLSLPKAFGRATDRPVIRGQGNVLAGVQFGVESGTAYFVDGVYYPGDLSALDLKNLERVEVIRGPQAALYGRNTYAGAINFITRGGSDEFEGDVRLKYGEDKEREVAGSIAGPIWGDVLSGRLNAQYYTFDGEYDNIVTGEKVGDEETTTLSGTLDWDPSDNLSFRLTGSWADQDDGTRAFFLQPSESNNCFPGTRSNASWLWTGSSNNNQYFCGDIERPNDYVQLNDGPARNGVVPTVPGIPDQPLPGFSLPGVPGLPPGLFPGGDPYNPQQGVAFSGVEREVYRFGLQGDWDIGGSGWNLIGNFAYRDEELRTGSDSDHTSINYLYNPFFPAPPETVECTFCASEVDETDDYSVELRIESPQEERLRYMFGAFYYDQTVEGSDITYDDFGGGPQEDEAGTENIAVFGMVEYDFTDRFSSSLELRWFDEEKTLEEYSYNPDGSQNTDLDEKVSFDEVAPRLSANWQFTDEILFYGTYAKGYKPGGLNGQDGVDVGQPEYDQEESDTFEIGTKTLWFDGSVLANAAIFFNDLTDIQLTTPLASGGSGTLTSIVTNQGEGEIFGVELELQWLINDNLTVGGTYALADTEFTKGCDEFQYTLTSGGGVLADADACSGNNVNGNANGSIKGNKFPLSSENQFSAYADFRSAFLYDTEFFANVSYTWEDEKPVQVHNEAWVPSASLVDARIGIETERWTFSAYGANLTDEDAPSMVTRWLQDPLLSIYASGPFGSLVDTTNAGAPAGACTSSTCATNFPRAFFGDMRRGRNFGVEFAYRFGAAAN